MRLLRAFDPIALRLLRLREVSRAQRVLRGLGLLATAAALMLVLEGGITANLGTITVTAVAAIGTAALVLWPDSDVGVLSPAAILLAVLARPEMDLWRAAAIGLLLLVAHIAWASAATAPVHGVLDRSARRLLVRSGAAALGAGLVGIIAVMLLSPLRLGPWAMIPAVLMAAVILAVLLPSPPRTDRPAARREG